MLIALQQQQDTSVHNPKLQDELSPLPMILPFLLEARRQIDAASISLLT
jgi:hypothetical protein